MIVYPKNWNKKYNAEKRLDIIYKVLCDILKEINVGHLAYSGGIDSTMLLCLLTKIFGENKIHTYTISSRKNHPDIKFAQIGSDFYKSTHHEFIVQPEESLKNDNIGDNSVRQFFNQVSEHTNNIICGDGIDEYMCGYYDHMKDPKKYYNYYLSRLLSDHLIPLDKNSKRINVYLPYLNEHLVDIMNFIDMKHKVDEVYRKKYMIRLAMKLKIPEEIVFRNKYGFCDSFLNEDK